MKKNEKIKKEKSRSWGYTMISGLSNRSTGNYRTLWSMEKRGEERREDRMGGDGGRRDKMLKR